MQSTLTVPLLAASPAALNQLHQIPSQTWINLGICILAAVLVVRTWRAVAKFNDFAPWIGAVLAGSFIMFYWVYERTEPKFLTPVVERLTYFLPTKAKQQADLERLRQSRDADSR